jgi:hypothetical protein
VAGLFDLGAALAIYPISLRQLLQGIASGVLGESASAGGLWTASFGLFLQLAMSTLIAVICVRVARRVSRVQPHWTLAGIAYGSATFVVMNYVVMPLSAIHRVPHFSLSSFAKNGAAMWVFGLVIAYFTREREEADQ